MNETGNPADWWFMYKVSGKSKSPQGPVSGGEYIYFDDAMAKAKAKMSLSPFRVDKAEGALFHTLGQLYGKAAKANKDMGWYFYNDENPITGKVVGSRGHTKGVLAFDLKADTAFWLVQSTPKFPDPRALAFAKTGLMMAQTLLCITLKDATTAAAIAKEMYSAQQPNVYAASAVPKELKDNPNDYRLLLMNDKRAAGNTPITADVPFSSKGGQAFRCLAKNKYWGLDFYNDLVGPRLKENLEVETWEHDPVPGSRDSDKLHSVLAMKSVNLTPLGVPIQWSEEFDHAKLAISDKSEKKHWVCVGDINFTKAQEKRGGGTVAFLCDPLWKELVRILSTQPVGPTKRK
jgi:deoxyribonuclease-2